MYILNGIPITDQYIEVDFCECECVSWVDPCDCGWFVTPCQDDVPFQPCTPPSVLAQLSTGILYGLPKIEVNTKPGFNMNDIAIMKPQVDSVATKFGVIPSTLKLGHNLAKASVLKEFLSRNKLKLNEEMDLVYSKTSNSWQKVVHLNGHDEKWTLVFSLAVSDLWKFDVHIVKEAGGRKYNTRVMAGYVPKGTFDGINVNYNTNANKMSLKQNGMIKNQTMKDEIGLFHGEWAKNPYLKLDIIIKKG